MLKKWIIRTEFLKETYLLHFHRATDQNLQETDERHDLINTMLRDSHQKVSHEKIFPWKFWNIHRKTPMLKSLFNKVTVLRACDFIKKSLQHRCFPVIIAKFMRTPIPKNICEWLVLNALTTDKILLRIFVVASILSEYNLTVADYKI